jgi:hypothetical protein
VRSSLYEGDLTDENDYFGGGTIKPTLAMPEEIPFGFRSVRVAATK